MHDPAGVAACRARSWWNEAPSGCRLSSAAGAELARLKPSAASSNIEDRRCMVKDVEELWCEEQTIVERDGTCQASWRLEGSGVLKSDSASSANISGPAVQF